MVTVLWEQVSPVGHCLGAVGSHIQACVVCAHCVGGTQATLAAEDVPFPSDTQQTVPAGNPSARQSFALAHGTASPLSFCEQLDAVSQS